MIEAIHPEALEAMRNSPHKQWAVYQNVAMDSSNRGHLRFLAVGPDCTFKEPPPRYPDTASGVGWRYIFIGWVDLDAGATKPP